MFYTRFNSVRVLARVVETAPKEFVHLEQYQDAVKVGNRHSRLITSPAPSQVPIHHLTGHPALDLDLVGGSRGVVGKLIYCWALCPRCAHCADKPPLTQFIWDQLLFVAECHIMWSPWRRGPGRCRADRGGHLQDPGGLGEGSPHCTPSGRTPGWQGRQADRVTGLLWKDSPEPKPQEQVIGNSGVMALRSLPALHADLGPARALLYHSISFLWGALRCATGGSPKTTAQPPLATAQPPSATTQLPTFQNRTFFRNPSVALGMGLGDHLVTIRELEHPWGPTSWLLGLCSPCHGAPESLQMAV